MRIKPVKIYGTKGGWRCEDSSNQNVAELQLNFSLDDKKIKRWKWEILGERERDYCMYDYTSYYTGSDTLVLDRESDAQGDDIYWLHSADSKWGDPSELYKCEYDMLQQAEYLLKEGAFKRIVNYTMAIGHFIDLLNDLNACRDEATLLLDWQDVKYLEYPPFYHKWSDDE